MPDSTKQSSGPELLLTQQRVAEILSYSPRTLESWRATGRGPRYIRVSKRSVRYRMCDLEEWVAERIQRTTSDDALKTS